MFLQNFQELQAGYSQYCEYCITKVDDNEEYIKGEYLKGNCGINLIRRLTIQKNEQTEIKRKTDKITEDIKEISKELTSKIITLKGEDDAQVYID